MITEQDLIDANQKVSEASKVYRDHVFTMKMYEGVCKDFLSSLKMQIRKDYEAANRKYSDAQLETEARSLPEWVEFRKEKMQKLKEAGRAEIDYKNAERHWKTIQSALSLEKARLQRFGD